MTKSHRLVHVADGETMEEEERRRRSCWEGWDADGGVRTQPRRKPEEERGETCIEKRCSALVGGRAGAADGSCWWVYTHNNQRWRFLRFRETLLMMRSKCRLSSRRGPEREALQNSAKNGNRRKHRPRRNYLSSERTQLMPKELHTGQNDGYRAFVSLGNQHGSTYLHRGWGFPRS